MKLYCDANVFIDYFEEGDDKIRPLKDFAFTFFSKGWNCTFQLIVSDWLRTELLKKLSITQIEEIFSAFRNQGKLIEIKEAKGDRDRAMKISSHWQDPLHAILAKKAGADHLVTRDMRGFDDCSVIIDVKFPEYF